MQQEGYDVIIRGIREEAERTAAEIIAEAERQVAQQTTSFTKQKERELTNAGQEADRQATERARAVHSQRIVREKRQRLKRREVLIQEIIDRVEADLAVRVRDPAYPGILRDWIVEAALGLHLPAAIIQTSSTEAPLITDRLLETAAERVRDISGRTIRLTLDRDAMLPAQGVVLTAPDRTVAFNNQVPVRLQRFQSRIRHIIYTRLFTEN